MADLDCQTYDSALRTFAEIHETTTDFVRSFIEGLHISLIEFESSAECRSYDDIMMSKWRSHILSQEKIDSVCWFHATRLFKNHDILENRILDLDCMLPILFSQVRSLCEKEISNDEWENFVEEIKSSFRYKSKMAGVDKGPFGFLIMEPMFLYRDISSGSRNYLNGSELIEDMCAVIGGGLGDTIYNRYLLQTSPCIIKFRADVRGNELFTVLYYLWVKFHDIGRINCLGANTCYDGCGNKVAPSRIVDVIQC